MKRAAILATVAAAAFVAGVLAFPLWEEYEAMTRAKRYRR